MSQWVDGEMIESGEMDGTISGRLNPHWSISAPVS